MYVRVQMTTEAFGTLLRERLKTQDLCIPADLSSILQEQQLVDHIEVDIRTKLQAGPDVTHVWSGFASSAVSAPSLQVAQDITVYQTTLVKLQAAGSDNPPETKPIPLTATFAIDVDPNGDALVIDFVRVDPLLADPSQDAQIRALNQQLAGKIPRQHVPFLDSGALGPFLPSGMQVAYAGLTWSERLDVVEIQIEYSYSHFGVEDADVWHWFYKLGPGSLVAPGEDWALMVDQDLLRSLVWEVFYENLHDSATSPLRNGPYVTWHDTPEIIVVVSVMAISACLCFGTKIDVPVDIVAHISFSIDNGALRLTVTFDYSAGAIQEFCCEVYAGLAFPFVEDALLRGSASDKRLWWAGTLIWALTEGISTAATALLGGSAPPPHINTGACHTEGDTIVCEYPLPRGGSPQYCTNRIPFGMAAAAVRGATDGLVIGGRLDVTSIVPSKLTPPEVTGFAWRFPKFDCSDISGELRAVASITLRGTTDQPLILCDFVVPGDPQLTRAITPSFIYCPYSTTLTIDLPADANPADPVAVLVGTSGGSRLITLAPNLADPDWEGFQQEVLRWRLRTCFTIPDPWYRQFGRFNVRWAGDPGPEQYEQQPKQHYHGVLIAGLALGDRIGLAAGEDVLAEGTAGRGGFTFLAAATRAQQSADPLAVMRLRPGADEPSAGELAGPLHVRIRQIALAQAGTYPLEPRSVMVGVDRTPGACRVILADPTGLRTVDLTVPQHAHETRRYPCEQVDGALEFGAGFLAFGPGGLTRIDRSTGRTNSLVGTPVRSVALYRRTILALAHGEILSLDSNGSLRARTPADDARAIAVTGTTLAVATRLGIDTYDLSDDEPRRVAHYALPDTTALALCPVPAAGQLLVTNRDRSITTLSVNDHHLRSTCHSASPGFWHAAPNGDRLFVVDVDVWQLIIWHAYASRTL